MSGSSAPVRRLATRLRKSVSRVLVGRTRALDLLLTALFAGGHVLLEDFPGTGKTTLARALAQALGGEFRRIQFTPDLMPADVVGVNVFDPAVGSFSFRPGPVFGNILLADEINRATPRAQSALLEAMQESQVSVDGVSRPLPSPFLVIATQNPLDLEGTFPLPEAQVDRFLMRLALGLPSREEEAQLLARFRDPDLVAEVEEVAGPLDMTAARSRVRQVEVSPPARDYILDLVAATRSDERLRMGASPRATLALQSAAQASAAMAGREYLLPDDVKAVAGAVLGHRLPVDSEAGLRGIDAGRIVQDLLATLPVPLG